MSKRKPEIGNLKPKGEWLRIREGEMDGEPAISLEFQTEKRSIAVPLKRDETRRFIDALIDAYLTVFAEAEHSHDEKNLH